MPNPTTNFKNSDGTDLGNILITKEYLMSVYPQIANQLITPELLVWGRNYDGKLGDNTTVSRSTPVTTFAGGANWKQVACGGYFMAAIKTDGTLWTWGQNSFGQLGDNTTTNRSTPVTTFAGGTNWKQVSCGFNHTAAIKTDGTLWIWGSNGYESYPSPLLPQGRGILGNNNQIQRMSCTPITTFAGGANWKQVSCGGLSGDTAGNSAHTAGIKNDGTLWIWGFGLYGQLGSWPRSSLRSFVCTPVTTIAGGTNWKSVSCGYAHTAAIKNDGTLYCWGKNYNGAVGCNVGNISSGNIQYTPVTTFAGGTNWKQVSCGADVTAAIKTDGTLWTWGAGACLGNFGDQARFSPVTTFAGGTNWKQVSCSLRIFSAQGHTEAIKTDGTLWGWGLNYNGAIGNNNTGFTAPNGTTQVILTPVTTFAGGTNWKQVACGFANTAAIQSTDIL
jgi:alpha-tubulin suppressor-like RCC1 family protein